MAADAEPRCTRVLTADRVLVVNRVLVANRGEIAVRVVRACRDLGLTSIAVYTGDDLGAPHARVADEAWALRPAGAGAAPARPYLDAALLLEVARRAGVDAVHPGYGFLSEDAAFARAVLAAGLTWIGPSPEAIALLGDKAAARELAARVGAPLAPGSDGPVAGPDDVLTFARRHGYPVLIKAVHGGGGRGMRVVHGPDDVDGAWAGATAEAQAAFGRGDCLVERYLERARHVETQCLADRFGQVRVLGTRDCSLQRRHQKLVEEAPAPGLPDGVADLLAEASVALLRACGYVGAATCEFLLAEDGTVTFCEVNTRIQVEHPVTEESLGVDLVAAQLLLAAGHGVEQALGPAAPPRHAVEFRITAEDPARGFAPSPGTITTWRMPSGPGVRVDSGVELGSVVGSRYDSLLAKIVVSGATREQALARARRALAEADVAGVSTTLPWHRALLSHPDVLACPPRTHTRWVDDTPALVPAASAAAVPTAPGVRVADLPGTVLRVAVATGDVVVAGQVLVVLEAMKTELPVTATGAATVADVHVTVGDLVEVGRRLVTLTSAGS